MKWEYKTLDQLGTVSRGKSKHRPRNDPKLFGGKYPFIQTADVKNADYYITKYSDTYNESGVAQSKLWDKGTLCITIAANIADTGVLAFPACFPDSISTRVFVVISLGTVTPAVLAGVFVLVPSFIIRFPRCRLLCAPGRVSPQSGSPAPSLLSKVGIRPGFYGAQRTSFPRCGSSVLPGGKVPGGLCLRPCSVRLWGY